MRPSKAGPDEAVDVPRLLASKISRISAAKAEYPNAWRSVGVGGAVEDKGRNAGELVNGGRLVVRVDKSAERGRWTSRWMARYKWRLS